MSRRIEIDAWGKGYWGSGQVADGYALQRQDSDGCWLESRSDAVARSIARRTGLVWCCGPRSDGTSLWEGQPDAHHYVGTLGRRCSGGGFTPMTEVYFSVPVLEEADR
mgnify:CR=1 FL=1